MNMVECMGCGGLFAKLDGPVHRYMDSSPGCWAAFGEVMAHEYSNPDLFEVHRLSVDAYAVQHPGRPSRQSIHSVGVHLIRLCLFLEHGLSPKNANDAMLKAASIKNTFFWLEPPQTFGPHNVAEVGHASGLEAHKTSVRQWAQSAWASWTQHHDTIEKWILASPINKS